MTTYDELNTALQTATVKAATLESERQVNAIALASCQEDLSKAQRDLAFYKTEVNRLTVALAECEDSHTEPPVVVVPPKPVANVRIGMSAPVNQWISRLAETGPVEARRLFGQLSSMSGPVSLAKSEVAAGRYPVLSFKLPGNDWVGAANGLYDTQFRALASALGTVPGRVFVAIHHEPAGDGAASDFASMQRQVLPLLSTPANVDVGVIANGWWWSNTNQGYTDAEIAQWLPSDVRALCDVIACDTYQAGDETLPGEDGGVKARKFSAWATRLNVPVIGLGEFNGFTAAAITSVGDAVFADNRYAFACVWNNTGGLGRVLAGDRLTAFKAILAQGK